jgi:hypothetical protein
LAKLIRERGWLRPGQRVHPAEPTVGVRAAKPNEIWHIDTTILKLRDGTTAYLRAVIDNYSRKILAWTMTAQLEPTATCQVLFAPASGGLLAFPPVMGVICAGYWSSEGRCSMKEGGLVPAAAPSPSWKGSDGTKN